MTSNIISK